MLIKEAELSSLLLTPWFLQLHSQKEWKVRFVLMPCLGESLSEDDICGLAARETCERLFQTNKVILQGHALAPIWSEVVPPEHQSTVPGRLAGHDQVWAFRCDVEVGLTEPHLPPTTRWPGSSTNGAPMPLEIRAISLGDEAKARYRAPSARRGSHLYGWSVERVDEHPIAPSSCLVLHRCIKH